MQKNLHKMYYMLKMLQRIIKMNTQLDLNNFSKIKNCTTVVESLQTQISHFDKLQSKVGVVWFYLVTRLYFSELTTKSLNRFSDLAFLFKYKKHDQQFNELCKLIDLDENTILTSKDLFHFRKNILVNKKNKLIRMRGFAKNVDY